MGDASSVRVAISPQTTEGTAEPAGTYSFLRFSSEDLRHAQQVEQSDEIDPTRQPAGSDRVNRSAAGPINTQDSLITPAADAALTGYDILHKGACMSAWSAIIAGVNEEIDISGVSGGTFTLTDQHVSADAFTNASVGQWLKLTNFDVNGTIYAHVLTKPTNAQVTCEGVRSTGAAVVNEAGQLDIGILGSMIRISNTKRLFTIERQHSDLGAPGFALLVDMLIASWQWSATPQQTIRQTFNMQGSTHTTSTTSNVGTPAAKWATDRLKAPFDVKMKMEGTFESVATDRIAEFSFTLDNRPRLDFEVGSDSPQVGISTPTLTGVFNTFMDSVTLQQKIENETISKLALRLDDGTRQRIFTFPRIKYVDGGNPASGNDQSVVQQANFSAEPDSAGIAFQIDRF